MSFAWLCRLSIKRCFSKTFVIMIIMNTTVLSIVYIHVKRKVKFCGTFVD